MLSMRDLIEAAPVRLAPMASHTNAPFRQVARECGAGFSTNEEIDAEALLHDSARTARMTATFEGEGPLAMQLLGSSAATLVPAAIRLVEAGAAIIDINMGCPATKAVRKGKGAALMRDVPRTAAILTALRRALDGSGVPLTIKIRGGWDDACLNAIEVARMAEEVGVDAITVHPRTRSQQYAGRAPWDVIADVVRDVRIPVTGNGDVTSLEEARLMMAQTGCAGVMIGRGALGRPWVFDASYPAQAVDAARQYEARVIARHLALIEGSLPPREALAHTKRHLSLYAAGRADASMVRNQIFRADSIEEARAVFEGARALEGVASR
ncbi:MAG: tRNA-dihydrouridine synthase family protein [Dehalococcoidia bacterium]|nr:tRNA-dihydrouridine synthase family protein [Dehalococcoidia bacterium]